MFIWCKAKEKGKPCLLQSWAVYSPFATIFRCPVHGLVTVDGKQYQKAIITDIDGKKIVIR